MSGAKIGGPSGPKRPPVEKTQSTGRSGQSSFSLNEGVSRTDGAEGPDRVASPAELVAQIRAGDLNAEQAVDLLVNQALSGELFENVSDEAKAEIRQAIVDRVQDDPALAAFVRALER